MRRTTGPCLVLAVTLVAGRQATATPLRLTVEEAVARAARVNLDLGLSRKDVDVAQAEFERSRAWFPSNPFFSTGLQHTSQTHFGPNYVFLLSQEIEIGLQRSARIGAAEEQQAKATWDVKSAEQTVAATVKTVFLQAQIDADRVTLARQSVDAASQLLADLTARPVATDLQRIEVNVARIQESRAKRELVSAERTRDNVVGTLRRALALPAEQEIELAGAPRTDLKELPAGPELIERALRERPDLIALRHDTQRADRQLTLTRREAIPNVTLSATVSRFEGDTLAGGDIGLPLPVFRGKGADLHEAVAERERAGLQVQRLEELIRQEVVEARRACVETAQDLLTQQQDIVPRSEENYRLQQRQFERGAVSVSDLVGLQIDLITARRDYLDALEAYNSALIELERLIGGSL